MTTTEPVEPRVAGSSKSALLTAARELFGQRGFEGTTVRDIGELAGVDHALIARYYGSKADLYVAALVAEAQGDQPGPAYEGLADMAQSLIARMDARGVGPVLQAIIRSETSAPIRQAAQAHLARRLVEPTKADMVDRGIDEADLRAELAVSALLGIALGRALGWFDHLRAMPQEQLVALTVELLGEG
ncbi:MAG TPA: TetR family transcriptional regulator [Acidimicrobiales bacterium]|jgi:AcrR family transcriptional regulator|nr:TetR family transcriptional regulator [Acidimicrobiales bacterium]